MTDLEKFLHVAPPIDDHREDAARCCEETARSNALKSTGMLMRIQPAMCWDMAAKLLRGGWQRDHRLLPMVTKGKPS